MSFDQLLCVIFIGIPLGMATLALLIHLRPLSAKEQAHVEAAVEFNLYLLTLGVRPLI